MEKNYELINSSRSIGCKSESDESGEELWGMNNHIAGQISHAMAFLTT